MKITVNNRVIEAKPGETIFKAVTRAGIHIPTLCYLEGLAPSGACRICVVEVDSMGGRLIPSCSFPVSENMVIHTHSPKAVSARKTIIELLLSDHPDDCLYCVRNGDCELSKLAQDYGVRRRLNPVSVNIEKKRKYMDLSSPSLVRDPEKCILCGKCIRVCEEIQNVSAIDFINRGSKMEVACAFDESLNTSSCINCGQCVVVCPTGALSEKSHIEMVIDALNDPDKMVVIQHAPSISVSIAEEFGMPAGIDACGIMTSALRTIGFDKVFDTSFSADLTIMEEASEFVSRLQNNGTFPMMTSCSPGWIKYVEQFYPDFLNNLSTCKSPQQMMGAVIKTYFAEKENIEPSKIFSVSVMPCTAKKFECERPEMSRNGVPDIDAVLTTRELAQLFRLYHIDFNALEAEGADTPFGTRSTAGKIFGATGGVTEAAIRTAYFLATGKELTDLKIEAARGLEGRKEFKINVGGTDLGFAVVNSLGQASKLLDEIRKGKNDVHFIEVMTCPGGCINGGGQPRNTDKNAVIARLKKLYEIDKDEQIRMSHRNIDIKDLYDQYFEKPLSEKSHHILHTHYTKRDVI